MRFFEFQGTDTGIDKFIVAIKNHIGRASSKKAPAKLNWGAIASMSRANGFEFAADYETFKSLYDSNPLLQSLIKDFNDQGLELMVPGAPDEINPSGTAQDSETEIDRIASSAAPKQLAQTQQTPKT
jgi:hypothetical protein